MLMLANSSLGSKNIAQVKHGHEFLAKQLDMQGGSYTKSEIDTFYSINYSYVEFQMLNIWAGRVSIHDIGKYFK